MENPRSVLGADERVVLAVRPHGRVLVGPAVVLLVLAPVTLVVAAFVGSGGVGTVLRIVVLLLGGAVVVRACVVPFLQWRSTVYTVTTQRVAVRRGVVSRFGRDVPLAQVSKVTTWTGPWDRAFGSGRLRIEATGERPLLLHDVPAVAQVQRTVQTLADPAAEQPDELDGSFEEGPPDDIELDDVEPEVVEIDDVTWRRRGRGSRWRR